VRTIIITGLSQCKPATDAKALYKRVRKIGDVEKIVYPAASTLNLAKTSEDIAHVVFRTPNHAMTAVAKLHAHTYKAAQISVVLKKRADGAARLESHMRPDTKEKRLALQKKLDEQDQRNANMKKPHINQSSRLIIRNLPFDATERDLRAIFLPFGPIYSIDVPQKETANDKKIGEDENADIDAGSQPSASKAKGRGFAFVWMVSRSDAVKAMAGVNGTAIGHGAAERAALKAAKGKAGREKAKEAHEEVLKTAQQAREVAVDWALSKSDWENREAELAEEESEAEPTKKVRRKSGSESDASDSDLDPMEIDEESGSDDGEGEEDERPSLPKPEEGTTLFIRNLPYQATEEELRELFHSFGPMRYAKLTMDKQTKRPKGTAFVCFWQKENADKALEQARKVAQDSSTSNPIATKAHNPFSAPSILTADPSSLSTVPLTLHGRVLSVTSALDRTQADTMATAAQAAREKKDKRNTYLMREGVPMPGTDLAERLSEAEIDRRLQSFQMRKAQMAKNPSLYVSKTRLSVRQLPLFVTERILKRVAEHAVKEFDRLVEAGERQDLSNEELEESRKVATEFAKATTKNASQAQKSSSKKQELKAKREEALLRRQTTNKGGFIVQQTKVIRAKDRLDATTGRGRSQGYGFIEMTTFADALKVVRFANGNNSLRKLMLTWYADELGTMAKKMAKEATDSSDVDEKARLKRINSKKAQLDAGQVDPEEEGTRAGLLVVEFSIENVVTVKRRSERIHKSSRRGEESRDSTKNGSIRPRTGETSHTSLGKRKGRGDEQVTGDRESKKARRPATWNQKTKRGVSGPGTGANSIAQATNSEPARLTVRKAGEAVGSMIGRKRKAKQTTK
jgi:nucleolar protein 4